MEGLSLQASGRSRRRLRVNRAAEISAIVAALIAVGALLVLIGSVLARAFSSLNLDFFLKGPAVFGQTGGGIAPAFVGTFVLVLIASAIALPIGVLIAIYVSEFAPRRISSQIKLWLDVLNGFPSIIIGIFVFALVVQTKLPVLNIGHHESTWAGGFALSIIMLPLVARTTIEVLALVPNQLREASYALGVSKWRTVVGVVLPSALGGIVTGTTLAVARAAGETAPLLFTCSIFGSLVNWDPSQSAASIPLIIFQDSESPDRALNAQAWAAAFVLITVHSRYEPRLADHARPLPPQARPGQLRARGGLHQFVTPSSHHRSPSRLGGQARSVRHGHNPGQETIFMKQKGFALLAVAAVALLTAVGAGARSQATILNGAGSTFVQPLVSTWTPALGSAFDYTIQYAGVGSGAGITAISNRTVDFGASDAPLTAAQFTACNGCAQIPWALGATAMAYNIPGGPVHLHLSAVVIANIYLGNITNWDDPAIAKL